MLKHSQVNVQIMGWKQLLHINFEVANICQLVSLPKRIIGFFARLQKYSYNLLYNENMANVFHEQIN